MTTIEQKWFERVQAWRASGQSAGEFSTGREFTVRGLRHWAYLLKRRGIAPRPTASAGLVRLARVDRSSSALPSASLLVEFGGTRLTVPPGFDEATLRAAIGAVLASGAGGTL
jgi:hypothetical protein